MIIVMKPKASDQSVDAVIRYIRDNGLQTHLSRGEEVTIIGVVGDKTKLSEENLLSYNEVEKIVPVTESYKLVNRKFHPDPTTVYIGVRKDAGGAGTPTADDCKTKIGPGILTLMAGPCAVENEEQLLKIAREVKENGATILRGGAFKPRTSPYSFQGLEEEGLKYLKEASEETGLATITEAVSISSLELSAKYVDMIQIGARNMQNFELLKEVGRTGLPVMLKRGLSATIDEWLNAAEYIMSEGNHNVVLCERGIRTFEKSTRNTLDLSAVPVLREKTHLPVIVDPSHATGHTAYVPPMAKAAVACDADGLMVEVHYDPAHALSDGQQSLNFAQFAQFTRELRPFAALVGRSF